MVAANDSNLVIRKIGDSIVTFSRPFTPPFPPIPLGGRSVAVKTTDGKILLSPSHPLDQQTLDALKELGGSVVWIIGLDADHHLFLKPYAEAFPEAALIGVQGHLEKVKDLKWTAIYGRDADPFASVEDIDAIYFSGFAKQDVAILHKSSKTLITADLLFNLPAKESWSKSSKSPLPFWPLSILVKSFNPYGGFHKKFLSGQVKDKESITKDAKAVVAWDFDRIIVCHGDVIETKGKEAFSEAWKAFL